MGKEIREEIPKEQAVKVGDIIGHRFFFERQNYKVDDALERYERVDLRHLDTYTIDPEGAHEHDDALSVEKHERGGELEGYTAWVHVADVPSMVPKGSFIDHHAREKSRTFYYSDGTDDMLPPEILERVSLEAGEIRPANTIEMRFDEDGDMQGWNIYRSVINIDFNLSYGESVRYMSTVRADDEMDRRLHNTDDLPWDLSEKWGDSDFYEDLSEEEKTVVGDLDDLEFLAHHLADERRDSLVNRQDPAMMTVQEFMVQANRVAAREMTERGGGLYRAHGTPEGWDERVASYLEQSGMDEIAEELRGAETVEEVLEEDIDMPFLFNEDAEDDFRAYYSVAPRGHEGLDFEVYAPLTSPARRYPDNVNWRLIHGESDYDDSELARIATRINSEMMPGAFTDEKAEFEALAS
ncbi:MAG: ribonuclease catalytic domain-containing protein [Candidatus Nanohaloarchaeota archaeon QJJ-7]|nr:ribonuclease catalytic domain-containing protein [Candidatus Nanohaloarchaeota archaeon QJJ-7]